MSDNLASDFSAGYVSADDLGYAPLSRSIGATHWLPSLVYLEPRWNINIEALEF